MQRLITKEIIVVSIRGFGSWSEISSLPYKKNRSSQDGGAWIKWILYRETLLKYKFQWH